MFEFSKRRPMSRHMQSECSDDQRKSNIQKLLVHPYQRLSNDHIMAYVFDFPRTGALQCPIRPLQWAAAGILAMRLLMKSKKANWLADTPY